MCGEPNPAVVQSAITGWTSITDAPDNGRPPNASANERIKTAGDANETENTTNGTQEQASAISRRKKQG